MSIIIRPIEARDNPEVAELITGVLTGEFGKSGPGYACADPELGYMYENYQQPGSQYFVVFDQTREKVMGSGGYARLKGSPAEDQICELQKVYLYSELRGRGLGRQLVERCIEHATANGYRLMYLDSLPEMTAAIALYEKLGFIRLSKPLGNNGHHKCPIYMARPLVAVEAEPAVSPAHLLI